MIAALFLHEGWAKLTAYAAAAAYMRAFGVPEQLLPFAIALGVVVLGLVTAVGTLVVLRVTGPRRGR